MHHLKSTPIGPLRDLLARLAPAGVRVALGGSGLLGALGLTDHVRDWDLTTDETPERLRALLSDLRIETVGPSGVHADEKVMIPAVEIELICGFALRSADGVVRIPTVITRSWMGIPVGSPEAWAVAYALMGRPERADSLFGWLTTYGADSSVRETLLGQPLPAELRERLGALPGSSTT
jgi:hypothetical protein